MFRQIVGVALSVFFSVFFVAMFCFQLIWPEVAFVFGPFVLLWLLPFVGMANDAWWDRNEKTLGYVGRLAFWVTALTVAATSVRDIMSGEAFGQASGCHMDWGQMSCYLVVDGLVGMVFGCLVWDSWRGNRWNERVI